VPLNNHGYAAGIGGIATPFFSYAKLWTILDLTGFATVRLRI
jgi:hypothetical protein